MKTSGKIILYCLYAVVAVCVFLYLLFPSQTVSQLIVARISQASPEVKVSIDNAYPVFPPGLRLEPLEVTYAGIPIVRMGHLKVVPGLLSALSREKQVAFNGSLGHGTLNGRAELTLDAQRPQTRISVNLTQVPLDAFEVLDQWPGYQLAGEITSYMDYDSKKGSGGTANVRMEITPARFTFSPALLGLEQLEFSRIQSEMTLTPRMVQIKRCDLSGSQIEGKVSGSIIFRQPLENSRITLSCTVKPQPAFLAEQKNSVIASFLGSAATQNRGIVLRISGTLGRPNYVIR